MVKMSAAEKKVMENQIVMLANVELEDALLERGDGDECEAEEEVAHEEEMNIYNEC